MEQLRYISKVEMKDGQWYHGICRNAKLAMWNSDKNMFFHLRNKFSWFMETIEHFDDVKETGFDGFIPCKEVEEVDYGEMIKIRKEAGY